jgi:hypothetical protein
LPKSFLTPIITEKQEVIWTYYHWKTLRNVYSLPQWKYDIMDKVWLPDSQKLHYQILNNLECWSEWWYCPGRSAGPFQINIEYHKKERKYSMELINEKKYKELYEFQLRWTLERLESYKKSKCNKRWVENEVFRCMMIVHNWNNKASSIKGLKFKDVYAMKGLEIKNILLKLIY